jgi:hypothetical protein
MRQLRDMGELMRQRYETFDKLTLMALNLNSFGCYSFIHRVRCDERDFSLQSRRWSWSTGALTVKRATWSSHDDETARSAHDWPPTDYTDSPAAMMT